MHAWVLMGNHYHSLVETPQANLVAGMGWLQNTGTGLAVLGLRDQARDRRRFVERLEEICRGPTAREAGWVHPRAGGLQSTLRRRWYWGSEALKERLLKLKAGRSPAKCRDYRLSLQERDFGEAGAERIVIEGLAKAGLADGDLAKLKGSDPRKVRIAARVWRETCVGQGWIAARLSMGSAGNVSQQLWRWRRDRAGRQSEPGKRRGIIREKYSTGPFPALSLRFP